MFLLEDAGGQAVDIVIRVNRDLGLANYRTLVHARTDEMDGAASLGLDGLEGSGMGIEPLKFGK